MSKVFEHYLAIQEYERENPEPEYTKYDDCQCQQCTNQDEAIGNAAEALKGAK